MPDNQNHHSPPSPTTDSKSIATELDNHNDLVTAEVKVYKTQCLDNEISSVLVGERGMYYPRHEENMIWLPLGLIKLKEPGPDGTQEVTLPRWLAAKKGLKYRG